MNKTLLIVDDEAHIGTSLKRSLSLAGYTVFTAGSAEEGFAILERQSIPVIICDQLMPQITGVEFLIKTRALYPDTIRIIFTAYAEFNTLSDALENGDIHKILTKPWEEEYLMTHLKSAFELYEKNNPTTPPTMDANTSDKTITNSKNNTTTPFATNTIMAIMITDSAFNIQSVNSTFCVSTGYDSPSIIGQKIQLIDLQQDPLIIKNMENALQKKGSWQGFIQLCKKSGESFSTCLSIASVIDSKKITRQYTYTFTVPPLQKPINQQDTWVNAPPL